MPLEFDLVVEALPAYEVGTELGRGAWGVVLSGTHRQLRRAVAIKQLPREFGADPNVRARFLSEARTLALFDHPHIVHINDFVEYEGVCLLIMDQLTGGTVGTRFRSEGFTPQAACALILAACAGLQYAHERGVLHRDVKPENLMFSGEGVLKVVDFGIAKLVGGSSMLATRAGSTLGTPAYIAPEQARSQPLSPATDVYATATVLYELLTGRLPYPEADDPIAAIYQHIHEDARPLLEVNDTVPPEMARIVDGALHRDPLGRPQSAEAFGLAVAQAATDAWGLGWSATTGIPLRGDGTMLLPSGERRETGLQTPRPSAPSAPAAPTIVHPGAAEAAPVRAPDPIAGVAAASAATPEGGGRPPSDSDGPMPTYLGGGSAPPAVKRNRLPILIGAGGLAIVVLIVVAVIALSGGKGSPGSSSSGDTTTSIDTSSSDSTTAPPDATTTPDTASSDTTTPDTAAP